MGELTRRSEGGAPTVRDQCKPPKARGYIAQYSFIAQNYKTWKSDLEVPAVRVRPK